MDDDNEREPEAARPQPPEDDPDLERTRQMPAVEPPAGSEPTIKFPQPSSEPTIRIPTAPDGLPDLEDITFEPEPTFDPEPAVAAGLPGSGPALSDVDAPPISDADAARSAAPPSTDPAEPVPRFFKPKNMSRRAFATLVSFAEGLVPAGGDLPSATETRVAERLDAAVASWHPEARRDIGRALRTLEWSVLASRALRPLSRLKPAARIAAVDRLLRSRSATRRRAAEICKFFALNQYASTASVEQRVGFDYSCLLDEPPRQVASLEILSYPQIDRDHTEDCDVVVVGSGAGGAVAAKELAELGLSVIVLEEGGSFERTDFSGPPFERFQRLYRKQGLTGGGPSVSIPLGMGVGGSTLVSAGTSMRAPDFVLTRWSETFGLPGLDLDTMRPFYDRVERLQRVQPVPEELLGHNAKALRHGAERIGASGGPLLRTIQGCRGCGTCTVGCPTDANLSVRLTYLPRAQRSGASIFAHTRATTIVIEDGKAAGIEADLLDPKTREPKARLTVRAQMVVLAAGAIHTPALLARNAIGNISGLLGKNLRVHPAAMVGATFEDELFPWRGTLQGYGVDDMLASHGVLIQSTAGVPSVSAGTAPVSGPRAKEMLLGARSVATAAVFVADTGSGSVTNTEGEPIVRYRLNDQDARRLVHGIVRCARIFFEAGATSVTTPLRGIGTLTTRTQLSEIEPEEVKAGSIPVTGWHPAGTARMGIDPSASVVDAWGRVHGIEGLFVADASILPEGPAVNPQTTVMAMATRLADHVARARTA